MQLEASIVRVFTSSGDVVGTGFFVGERTILTCAHVVATALGIADDAPTAPETPVSVDCPLVAPGHRHSAQVIFWQPIQVDNSGDIAVLHLEHAPPAGAKVARLVLADDLWDHPFRAFGFPSHHDQGVWASGKLRAREATGWIQIEGVTTAGKGVQRGFSGGAVWDEQLKGVAGMVVAADEDASKVAFMIPTKVLLQAWSPLGDLAIPPCPYRGLFAFREQDAPYFFGRETFTGDLLEAVRRKPLVAVVGPSGSGKSSVVFAGLLHRLCQEAGWIIASFRPGIHPFRSLAEALLDWLEPALSETDRLTEVSKLAQRLEQGELALQDVVERLLRRHSEARLLLIADQFEELYTLCREQEVRQHFLDEVLALVQAASQPSRLQCKVLLTLRADFLGHVLSYRPFADALQQADLKLGPMNRAELQDAIKKPAEKLQVKLEDGLAERILEAVSHEPGNLPLLEFALTQLWANQQAGQLTHEAYNEIGGVEQALTKYAEEVYQELSEEDRQRLERIFIQLVRPSEEIEDTRRIATYDEVGKDNWPLVVRLASARLVVSGRDETTGAETVELIHEALIQGWERLHQWSEENREFRTWQEQLRATLRQWESSGQDNSALLRGTLLRKAESWLKQRPDAIAPAEQDFIRASIELERKGRRNFVIGGLVGIATLATTGTGLALLFRSLALHALSSPTPTPNPSPLPAPVDLITPGILTIGSDTTYPPQEYIDTTTGKAAGFDIDLITAIAGRMGLQAKIVTTNFDTIIDDLIAMRFDVVMSAVTITPARQKVVDFVPYLTVGKSLLVQGGNPLNIASLADLCGQNVGVQNGTIEQDDLQAASNTCRKEGKPAIQLTVLDDQTAVIQLLADNRVVATYQDSIVADYFLAVNPGKFALGALLDAAPEGIVVRKGDTSMFNSIKRAFDQLVNDGTYQSLAEKWKLVNEEIR